MSPATLPLASHRRKTRVVLSDFARQKPDLERIIELRLAPRVQCLLGPEDVLQEIRFALAEGKFDVAILESDEAFEAYVADMARNKACNANKNTSLPGAPP